MSALHLFYVIVILLIISIVFIVISLVYHLRITSRLNNLEKDIEKKTLEFDSLKKDRSTGKSAVIANSPADMSTQVIEVPIPQEVSPQPVDEGPVEEGSIQIVRNVRGTFETTDTVIHGHGYGEQTSASVGAVIRPGPELPHS